MVSTVHERLDNVECQIERIVEQDMRVVDQNERILHQSIESARNQTAILHSAVHLIEGLPQIRSEVQQLEMRLSFLVRSHCAAKSDLEAASGQIERMRREFTHTLTNFATSQEQLVTALNALAAFNSASHEASLAVIGPLWKVSGTWSGNPPTRARVSLSSNPSRGRLKASWITRRFARSALRRPNMLSPTQNSH